MIRREESDSGMHAATRLVLPWLANGTLDGVEAERVERHLEQCADCRDELELERRLGARVREAAAVAPAPHPVQLARLWQRIDGETGALAPRDAARSGEGARLAAGWRWLLVAQAAAIVALAAIAFAPRAAPPPALFRTLAAAPPGAPAAVQDAERGRRIRVVFVDALDQLRLREILLPLGAEIVAGPSPLGVYTLGLSAERGSEPLAWVVAHLRALPEVRFAELLEADVER